MQRKFKFGDLVYRKSLQPNDSLLKIPCVLLKRSLIKVSCGKRYPFWFVYDVDGYWIGGINEDLLEKL